MAIRHKQPTWRRIAFYFLLLGLAIIGVRLFEGHPVQVTVVYHLDGHRERLRYAQMVYTRRGESVASTRYHYGVRPARSTQHHRIALPRGDYDVTIELRHAGGRPQDPLQTTSIRRRLRIDAPGEYVLHLPRDQPPRPAAR